MPPVSTLEELCARVGAINKASPDVWRDAAEDVNVEGLRSIAQQLLELSDGPSWPQARPSAPRPSWPQLGVATSMTLAAAAVWLPAFRYDFSGGFFMDDAMIKLPRNAGGLWGIFPVFLPAFPIHPNLEREPQLTFFGYSKLIKWGPAAKNPNVYEELNWSRLFRTDYWGLDMFTGDWTHKSFRPLTVLTFRWNHALVGSFEGSGFHVVNVLLNFVCSVLLGLLGYALGLSADFAVLLGALFLAHPIHTESVLYVVGRADLLCLLLILVATLLYTPCVQEWKSPSLGFLLLPVSALLIVAAGLCKETGFCFFGLLAGWEILVGLAARRCGAWRLLRFVAMIVLGSVACGLRVWYTGGTAIDNMDPHSNPIAVHTDQWVRLRSYSLLHGIYMKLLFFPNFLSYDYSFDAIPLVFDVADCRLMLSLTSYLIFFMLLVLSLSVLNPKRPESEAPIIGMAILLLSFVPMSNILFPVGTMIGERLLYVPSAGLLLTVVSLTYTWCRRATFLLWIACSLGVWRCAFRVPEWKSSESITVADGLTQRNSARVQFNLANVYLQAKQYDLALETYQRSINIDPTDHDALPLYHAGQILFFKGQHQDAARYLEKAVNGFFSPLTIHEEEIWHDYALSLWFVQKPEASVAHFQKALAINPQFTKAMNNMACAAGLGAIQGVLPRDYYQHAINALDQAVRIDPGNVLYWRNAVALMSAGGDASRAAATWQQLVAMDPQGAANPPRDCSWEFYFR